MHVASYGKMDGVFNSSSIDHSLPETPLEETLAKAFSEALRLHRVDTRESFFDLGGHSLLAAKLVSLVCVLKPICPPLGGYLLDCRD